MEGIACSDLVGGGADIKTTDHLLRELLTRVTHLEQQITNCLESQPLLYQVADKCNKQETDLKNLKKELDRRFEEVRSELTNLYHQSGPAGVLHLDNSESDEGEEDQDQDPEWHPELEDGGSDYAVDVKPYQCKFCPDSPKKVFDGAEGLADHYTSQHPIAMSALSEPLTTRKGTAAAALFGHEHEQLESSMPDHGEGADVDAGHNNTCLECGRRFGNQPNLRRHVKTVHLDPGLTCEFCEKPFHRKDKLKEHQLRVHKTVSSALKRVKKVKKPKHPASRSELEPDAQSQFTAGGRDRDYVCPECSRTYLTQANLTRHMISTHAAPSLSCEFCEKRFHRKDKLKIHQLRMHGRISDKLKRVDILAAMGLHPEPDPNDVQWQSGDSSSGAVAVRPSRRRVLCPECGRSVTRCHLPAHMLTHTGEKPHVCEICGKPYKEVKELTIHRRRHTGERPFACTHVGCEKRFTSRATLRNHLCIHTGKPYVCEECGRTFVKGWMLKMHKKRHAAASASEGGEGEAVAGLMQEKSGERTGVKRKRAPNRTQNQEICPNLTL